MFSNLPDRTKTVLQLILVLVLLAGVLILVLRLMQANTPANHHDILFRVEASGGFANLTLSAGKVSIPKAKTQSTPWEQNVGVASGTEVYLTAANPTESGSITCIIKLDGQEWKKETATAPKTAVACAGIVP